MKIHEVEEQLGISKANIRFYEKQGLLCPERKENKYREYSQTDVQRLKAIVVLRKLGIPVQNIGKILNDELDFQAAIRENISELEAQIEQLEGSLNLSRQIAHEQEAMLDTDRYWNIIQQKEAQGEKFVDIVAEYWSVIGFPVIARKFGLTDDMSVKGKMGKILLICACYTLVRTFLWKEGNLLRNFLYWAMIILAVSAITFLIFWVGKHHPKIAAVLNTILLILCVVVLGGAILLLVGGVMVALWNWIF